MHKKDVPGSIHSWSQCPIEIIDPLYFDVETTGLRPDRGATITEVAVLDKIGIRFYWHVEMGSSPVALSHKLPKLFHLLSEGVVIGHNLSFDFKFAAYEADRNDIAGLDVNYVDTLSLTRRLAPDIADFKLRTVLNHLKIKIREPLHTAVGDARATRDLFWALVKRGGLKTISDAGIRRINWRTF